MMRVTLNLHDLQNITKEAYGKLGSFNSDESLYLSLLPWYRIVVDLLPNIDPNMPDGNQFHIGPDKNTYNVCFIYHKKGINIFECYIIAPEIVEKMKTDLLVSYYDTGTVACISFVKEVPAHFKIE